MTLFARWVNSFSALLGQFIGSSALLVIDPWVELIPVGRTFESAGAAMPSGIWG